MKDFYFVALIGFALSLALTCLVMPFYIQMLKNHHIAQSVSEYALDEYKNKQKTPIMGGLIFVLVPVVIYLIVNGPYRFNMSVLMVICSYMLFCLVGFLESGKTSFIAFTLEQDYFAIDGKTLLVVCEEGMEEYEEDILESSNTVMELVEDESDFTPSYLEQLAKKHNPSRIIIEYNGMWLMRDKELPADWMIEQQITHVDASTFEVFYKNMKSLFGEMVKNSDMVIFNRCDEVEDLDRKSTRLNSSHTS